MRTQPPVRVIALIVGCLAGQIVDAQEARLQAVLGGAALPPARVVSIVVDASTSDVDVATLKLDIGRAKPPSLGDSVEVRGGASIFKGEVVSIEPVFEAGGDSRIIVRALNRLHRLSRGRKSKTYAKMTDTEIVSQIAGEAGLVPGPGWPETSVPDFVIQHNQTDLEFLRERAARIGFEVVVDDKTLMLRRPIEPDPVPLGCSGKPTLNRFHPRLSSASQVKEVTVRGWDPQQKKEIIGKASRVMIGLSPGAAKTSDPGPAIDLGVVQGIDSTSAAYGAAKGTLAAMTATDLSAEADAEGNAALRVGTTVAISGLDSRFNGKYYVVGVSHRYHGASSDWRTLLRAVRGDRAFYVLPEVGDEVLVFFEHGDIERPVIVGTLWNEKDIPMDHGSKPTNDGRDIACLWRTK